MVSESTLAYHTGGWHLPYFQILNWLEKIVRNKHSSLSGQM